MTPIRQIIVLLLLLQLVSAMYLWILSVLGASSGGGFALFLASDLLGFAMIAYVYSHDKWGEAISARWILVGCLGLIILLVTSLRLI